MNRRILAFLTLALVATVGAVGITGSSSATWVDASTSSSTVTAAADWVPPSVAVVQPAGPARGTVTVTASASDSGSGVASVEIQVRAVGTAPWRTLCTTTTATATTTATYACSWNTTGEADGAYELRALAVDRAGYAATSATVLTTVANAAGVALAHPGAILSGSVPLQATLTTGAGLTWTVRIERTTVGGTTWQPLCTGLAAPYSCIWDTATIANGRYDLRAVATSGTTSIVSPVVSDVLVDNLAPTVSLTVPAGPLKGEVSLNSTASDAHSGLATVVIQAATSATGPWTDLCTGTVAAYSCRYDTTLLPYGQHHFRAVATDRAGNRAVSTVVGPRLVDNTVRSITLADPGSWLEGTVTLTATATSTAPITSVRFQRAPKGGSTWTDLCTDTAAPWTCEWNTRTVADGSYDLRAVLTDANGNQAISAVVGARTVDNVTTAFRGVDVQTTNGGTAGRVDAGDTLVLTFSRRADLATITPGWDGRALAVRLEFTNAGLLSDEIRVSRPGSTVNLGPVVSSNSLVGLLSSHATFDATMVATTEVLDGRSRTVVTVQVGNLVSGSVRTLILSSTLTWSPLAQMASLGGQPISTATVTESGASDRDF